MNVEDEIDETFVLRSSSDLDAGVGIDIGCALPAALYIHCERFGRHARQPERRYRMGAKLCLYMKTHSFETDPFLRCGLRNLEKITIEPFIDWNADHQQDAR